MAERAITAPPLTVENIQTVVQGVAWRELGKGLIRGVYNHESHQVDYPKLDEIAQQHQSDDSRLRSVIECWLQGEGWDKEPSWRRIIWRLDHATETSAAVDAIRHFAEPLPDPTLTVENVREVMAEVGDWMEVGIRHGVPDSKREEINQQSSTEREKSLALGDYWVNTAPDASWEKLARLLYLCGQEKAAAVMKQYLPQDPTLTVQNVREVMAKVGDWESVASGSLLHSGLDVPYSKLLEINQQSSTEREKSLALGDYWVNTDPNASWEKLTTELYQQGEERALAVVKQYLQQDPTLTVENVREVIAEVGNWEKVVGLFGLEVPYFKRLEIRQQSSTEREKCLALGDYWVNTKADASWEKLAVALYKKEEKRALAVAKQYLPQADPTLTTDNLMEVVKEVEHHWEDLGLKLGLRPSVTLVGIQLIGVDGEEIHRMPDVVDEYVRRYPTPSWKGVATVLQMMGLDKLADEVTTKYVREIPFGAEHPPSMRYKMCSPSEGFTAGTLHSSAARPPSPKRRKTCCSKHTIIGTQEPQMKDLVLIKVTEWYELGLQLGVDDAVLEEIEKNNRGDLRAYRRNMFRAWLRITPSPSYQQLVEALMAVGEGKEADLLCKKYNVSPEREHTQT